MKAQLAVAAAVAFLGLTGIAHAQNDDKARHFLRDALAGDNSEVMLGKLAADRAESPRVRRYGQMLADDHSMHREKVLKVGVGLGLPDDRQPMDVAKRERDKLQGMRGRDFDREFAKYMVKDHRKDIADYQKAARMRGEVGRMARATLPTLHKHLSTAEKLGG